MYCCEVMQHVLIEHLKIGEFSELCLKHCGKCLFMVKIYFGL